MHTNLKIASSILLPVLVWSSAIGQRFSVSYTPASFAENFSGNVFLYLSKDNIHPKDGAIGLELFPCYAVAVHDVKPGEKVFFDESALSYPVPLSDIERGEYNVQAVWDRNAGGRAISNSPGNMYSDPVKINLTKNGKAIFDVQCNRVIKEQRFIETQYIKEAKVPSALLTAFCKRPAALYAAVLLPKEYLEQPERTFPVLYKVGGYGADYHYYSGKDMKSQPMDTTPCIQVFLDGNCPLGHSVYANSDNNGPWGDALTQELIPAIEKTYRCNAARLLTGHSSGGWTVLWLQTHYPAVFTACWSSSPDPVDFRNFQQIDLYKDKNMFYDTNSALRKVATVGGSFTWAYMKNVYGMENVVNRGEQMHSFDAVFSAKNRDGRPAGICNAYTGDIDGAVVDHWKRYDLSLYLRTNWDQLKAVLDGKVRVSVGNQDNFLLNYSVHLLDDEMKKLGSKFIFAYYPGDHFTVTATPEHKSSGYQFLQQKYNEFMLGQGL